MQTTYSGVKASAKEIYALLCVQNMWHANSTLVTLSKPQYSSHANIWKCFCFAKNVLALSIFIFAYLSYSLTLAIRIVINICMYILISAFYSIISCILIYFFGLLSSICIYNPSHIFCFKSIPIIHYCVIALVINRNEIPNTLKEREFAGIGF